MAFTKTLTCIPASTNVNIHTKACGQICLPEHSHAQRDVAHRFLHHATQRAIFKSNCERTLSVDNCNGGNRGRERDTLRGTNGDDLRSKLNCEDFHSFKECVLEYCHPEAGTPGGIVEHKHNISINCTDWCVVGWAYMCRNVQWCG